MSIESVMTSNHLILCYPHLLLPSIFPIIRVFSNNSILHIRCPKYWNFFDSGLLCLPLIVFNFCPVDELVRISGSVYQDCLSPAIRVEALSYERKFGGGRNLQLSYHTHLKFKFYRASCGGGWEMLAVCPSQLILWSLTQSWVEKVFCVLGYIHLEWNKSFLNAGLARVRDGMDNGSNAKDFCSSNKVLVYFLEFFSFAVFP